MLGFFGCFYMLLNIKTRDYFLLNTCTHTCLSHRKRTVEINDFIEVILCTKWEVAKPRTALWFFSVVQVVCLF